MKNIFIERFRCSKRKTMQINYSNKAFSTTEVNFIIERLRLAENLGYIKTRNENNQYLIVSFAGVEEKGITPKWNIKISCRRGQTLAFVFLMLCRRGQTLAFVFLMLDNIKDSVMFSYIS